MVSPLIANVYLHYVFDLWADVWRKKVAKGDVIIVRYADDLVMGFQHRAEAVRFLEEFKERLAKFGLELHPDKTRLIEFGRYAAHERNQWGEGNRRPSRSWASPTTAGVVTRPRPSPSGGSLRKCEWLRSSRPSRLSFSAASMIVQSGRCMAPQGRHRLLPIPCCSRQHRPAAHLQESRQSALAKRSGSSQPTRKEEVGVTDSGLQQVDTHTSNPAPLSSRPLPRYTSLIRAVCVDAHVRIRPGGAQ